MSGRRRQEGMGERDGRKWESEEGNDEGKRTEMKEKEKESYFVLVVHQQM